MIHDFKNDPSQETVIKDINGTNWIHAGSRHLISPITTELKEYDVVEADTVILLTNQLHNITINASHIFLTSGLVNMKNCSLNGILEVY